MWKALQKLLEERDKIALELIVPFQGISGKRELYFSSIKNLISVDRERKALLQLT